MMDIQKYAEWKACDMPKCNNAIPPGSKTVSMDNGDGATIYICFHCIRKAYYAFYEGEKKTS